MTRCFICDRAVLGLDGIEAHLDTFMLQNSDSRDILKSGHYGDCHLACLARHGVGLSWAHFLRRHFEKNLGYTLLEERGDLTIFRGGQPEQYVLLWKNGAHYMLSPTEYGVALTLNQSITRHRKQRIVVKDSPEFNIWFCEAIKKTNGIALGNIYDKLKVPNMGPRNFDGLLKASSKAPYLASTLEGFDGELEIIYSFETNLQI